MTLRVCIAGATGWAGRALAEAVVKCADMSLVGAVSRKHAGRTLGELWQVPGVEVRISKSVADALETPTDVLVDYTKPDVVKANVLTAISKGVGVVIGTSGLLEEDFQQIHETAFSNRVGVIAAGNFSITAVLLERFAVEAARYLSSWEILDFASAAKIDAPSGVSCELAYRLAQVKKPAIDHPIDQTVGKKESRGATFHESQIHSVRLPGYVIALEIIFAEAQERLILRHEAGTGAEPYVPGALFAIRKVRDYQGLVRGLDTILDS